ncbi:MAG: SPOR domain-containing protein, partial [bacterium]|nr:SPOR domain-containing protein [bacterium]
MFRQIRLGERIRKFFIILFLCFSSILYGERYTVLVAICSDLTQARIIKTEASKATAEPVYIVKDSSSYKVKAGFFSSPESAKAVQTHLQKKIGNTQFIVKRQIDPPQYYPDLEEYDYDKQYTIVVGFCLTSGEAELVKKKTLESTDEAVNIIKDINYYKIEVGSFFSPESAKAEQISLQKRGGYKGFIEEKKIERRPVARPVSSRSIFPMAERPVSKTETSVTMAERPFVTAPVATTSVTGSEKSVTSASEKDTVPAEKTASFVPVKESKGYGIQIYAFIDRNRAVRSVNKYEEKYGANTIPLAPYNKVIAGSFNTKEDAEKLLTVLKKDYPDAFITKPQVVQVFKEVEEKPATEQKPATETKPTVEQKSVVEVKPVVQKTVAEEKSTGEQKPTTEPKQVTVQKPAVVEKPVVEAKSVK